MSGAVRGLAPLQQRLDNGATVIARQTPTHPAVTVFGSVPAGSGFDPEPLPGLAALTARTLDRGTATRSSEALAEAFDGFGVSLSLGATRHHLTFGFTCLSEDLEAVLALVADVLRHPVFPAEQVERRRTSLITSLRQDEDTPALVATNALMTLLYPAHPYGRPVKGTVASVERIERHALVDFHAAHVGAAGLRIVLVGDVEAERAVDLAAAVFGDWDVPGGEPLELPPVTPPETRVERTIVMPGKSQSDIAYGFVSIARRDPRYYAFLVLNNILGQYGLGGRLGDSIRERQGMAYYAYSAFDANVAPGPLVVRAGVSPANVRRAIASIDEEIARMAADGVTEQELADARQYLIGSMPRMLETNGGIASFLHSADVFGLGLDYDARLPGLIAAVSRDEVVDVARAFLAPERAAVVVAGPPEGRPDQAS
ncbi:MAG TPA: pitrilysin family protein [Vicinamibacterales bacterium]